MTQYTGHILVCGGTGCRVSQSEQIIESLRAAVEQCGLKDTQVIRTECFGFCKEDPVVRMIPDNTFYARVQPSGADEIVRGHLIKGRKVRRLLHMNPKTRELVPDSKYIGFYREQLRIALRDCGFIGPENIDEYIARDGYVALGKAPVRMTPEEVIKEIIDSGLRGRGGGGLPTGLKWQITRRVQAPQKYVVCNMDEGDPGAFMDRFMLEGDPHSIVEAMTVNGYCTGASKDLVYIRAKYPPTMERLKIAIRQAKEYGLLGRNIFGTDFSFDIEIRYGAEAFVCGEETALVRSMRDLRGEATVKPSFPSEHRYKGYPINVNSVKTCASVSVILLRDAKRFNSIRTEESKGTKVFALARKVNNVGLIEVPMGTTLREVISRIGGGIKDGKKFKAVQTGGPSGGCLAEKRLDLPTDYDSLFAAGSVMGSRGTIVMDEDDCTVAMAKFYLDLTVEESCGKCTPCRIGNERLHEVLQKTTSGNGAEEDLIRLGSLAMVIKGTALYGLGQTSPNPVLSTMGNFYDKYLAHVRERHCPSRQCQELVQYFTNPEKRKGRALCTRVCPMHAITGGQRIPHTVDPQACIRYGTCMEKCKFGAIYAH